jgi:charged multivesicular body protein 3
MKSINRFIYGPTPEEKIRDWQSKLRTQERQLAKEAVNVSHPFMNDLICSHV